MIHPRCATILAHAKHARWDRNRVSFERVYDGQGRSVHHYDGCAALVYFLRDLDRSTNPYPMLAHGVGDDTHWIAPELRQDSTKAKIRAIFGRGRR